MKTKSRKVSIVEIKGSKKEGIDTTTQSIKRPVTEAVELKRKLNACWTKMDKEDRRCLVAAVEVVMTRGSSDKKKSNARVKGYCASDSVMTEVFGEEGDPSKIRSLRFKTIRPVYETMTINEKIPDYINPEMRLTSPESVWRMFRYFLGKQSREWFLGLHLDVKNRILATDVCSIGSQTQAIIQPRDIIKSALLSSAAAMIFVHNHPSGDPTPSKEDREITRRLKDSASLIGIPLLDHIIVTEKGFVSFTNKGIL